MTAMELLEVFTDVKDKYIVEVHSERKGRASLKKDLLIIVIAAAMLLLMGCAVVLWKLGEMKVGEYTYNDAYMESIGKTQTITKNLISAQGFQDSANYQAAKEWHVFLESYDQDGTLLKEEKADDYERPAEYEAYTCYTQQMQDKVDEICEKYDLTLLGPICTDVEVLLQMYGIHREKTEGNGILFAETEGVFCEVEDGYFYRDGTFQLSGNTTMKYEESPWIYPIHYQYRCVRKTAFDAVSVPVDELETYEEWSYTMKDGTQVLLALSPQQALIFVDQEAYFVTINVLETRVGDILYGEQQMSKEVLEAFADTFVFDYVPVKPADVP